ncbi:MAG: hypothetical protein LBB59_06595 [Campylobacteraceae bacterium]|nr:hypothetical protein [Campylobacteraceae bacterium]
MNDYKPVYTITPEILNLSYELAAILERIDIIRERALTPMLRRENRIKNHSLVIVDRSKYSDDRASYGYYGRQARKMSKKRYNRSKKRHFSL